MSLFLTIVISIYILMNYTTYRWVTFGYDLTGTGLWIFRIGFWSAVLAFLTSWILGALYEEKCLTWIQYSGYLWLGMLFQFFLIGLLTFGLWLATKIAGHFNPSLLITSGHPILWSVVICLLFIMHAAGWIKARTPETVSREIIITRADLNAQSFKIVQLSDIHLDKFKSPKWWNDIVEKTNQLKPDLIVLTGDIIDGKRHSLDPFLPGLKALHARYGIFAVTGNHEFYVGLNHLREFLNEAGIRLLEDESAIIPNTAHLIGFHDPTGRGGRSPYSGKLKRLTEALDKKMPLILLQHQPVFLEKAQQAGIDLQLSGHTHNGQIWPFTFFTGLRFPYQAGYYAFDTFQLFVSSGTGTWGPPVRIGTQSEIVEIIVTCKPAATNQ